MSRSTFPTGVYRLDIDTSGPTGCVSIALFSITSPDFRKVGLIQLPPDADREELRRYFFEAVSVLVDELWAWATGEEVFMSADDAADGNLELAQGL